MGGIASTAIILNGIFIFGFSICLIFFFTTFYTEKKYDSLIVEQEITSESINIRRKNALIEKQEVTDIAKIISFKEEKEYINKYLIKYQNNKFLLYTNKDVELEYGDIIKFQGYFEKVKSAGNFKLFDYSRFLRQNKIYGILKGEEVEKVGQEKDMLYYLEQFKMKLKQNLFSIFNEEQAGFLSGLLLGDKSEVLQDTIENFRNSSLSHILAISGMHVVYISVGVRFLLDLITIRQKLKNILMIFFLMLFAIFTGGSPSCLRACIMCSMILLSKVLYRKNDFYITLLFSLDIILILNCYSIESMGLWLSYLSTFGIVYIDLNNSKEKTKSSIIIENIKTCLSCNIMIFPIMWNSYNRVSFTFLISNILVSIFIGPIIILGYIHVFLGKISISFSFIEKYLLVIVLKIANFFGNLKISKLFVPSIHYFFGIFYYVFVLSFFFLKNHKEILKKYQRKFIYILGIGILIRHYNINT